MTNALNNLIISLENAVSMIDDSLVLSAEVKPNTAVLEQFNRHLNFTRAASLLDKCNNIGEQHKSEKPVLRIIHHLACSGGTIICQCIATMPNTFLLSEMHPTTQLHYGDIDARFTPTDFVMQARYGNLPKQDTLAKNIFVASVKAVELHLRKIGGELILRDHTHSDYSLGSKTVSYPILKCILEEEFQVKSLLTIRDPIDSYLSLIRNEWLHFTPASFDEYCCRFIAMASHYTEARVCKYEDFVDEPVKFMKDICKYWELPFSDDFTSIFDIANVSGGSGRKSQVIQQMERKLIPENIMDEIVSSVNYKKICSLFKYGL